MNFDHNGKQYTIRFLDGNRIRILDDYGVSLATLGVRLCDIDLKENEVMLPVNMLPSTLATVQSLVDAGILAPTEHAVVDRFETYVNFYTVYEILDDGSHEPTTADEFNL